MQSMLLFFKLFKMEDKEGAIKAIGRYSYYTKKCLGEGSFGKVFEGYENNTLQKVAIKKVDFKTLEKDTYLQKAIHEEIRILSKFKHPNIVQLREVLNSKRSLYIIMDYCKDGDLKKYIKTYKKLSETDAIAVMRQIINGYQQLAKEKTIHRDLKPANILVNNGLFKICDFGFSKIIKDSNTSMKTCVGSPIYMAPQILQKNYYSAKCDIWSLGIIFYELINGTIPWTAKSQKQLLSNIKNNPLQFQVSCPKTEKIIRWMLQINEQKRASLSDLQCFFNLQSDSVNIPIKINEIQSVQQFSQQKLQTTATIKTRVLNRNYFQELAWRYFICTEINSKLPSLNRYNFTKHIYQRFLVLTITSIISNFMRHKNEIDSIHQSEAVSVIMKQYQFYQEFKDQLFRSLNLNFATCQILKQFQMSDIALGNFTEQVNKKSQRLLIKTANTIVSQISEEVKLISQQSDEISNQSSVYQKSNLLSICELIMDMMMLNEKQARTGISDIGLLMVDRKNNPIEKRISFKVPLLKNIITTQLF